MFYVLALIINNLYNFFFVKTKKTKIREIFKIIYKIHVNHQYIFSMLLISDNCPNKPKPNTDNESTDIKNETNHDG